MTGKPKRATFTNYEKDYLKKYYENEDKYPDVEARREIASHFDKPLRQISNWFKNERAATGDSKNWVRPSYKNGRFRKRAREDETLLHGTTNSTLPGNETTVNDTINSSVSEVLPKPKNRKKELIASFKAEMSFDGFEQLKGVPTSTPRPDVSFKEISGSLPALSPLDATSPTQPDENANLGTSAQVDQITTKIEISDPQTIGPCPDVDVEALPVGKDEAPLPVLEASLVENQLNTEQKSIPDTQDSGEEALSSNDDKISNECEASDPSDEADALYALLDENIRPFLSSPHESIHEVVNYFPIPGFTNGAYAKQTTRYEYFFPGFRAPITPFPFSPLCSRALPYYPLF